jgi:hypothetical protein
MHLPLAYLLLHEEEPTIINDIDRGNISLNILTGLQALSRSSENQNLVIAASEINAVVPAFTGLGLSKKWKLDSIAEFIMAANGVDITALQYTEEEMIQMQEAEAEASAASQMQAQAMGQGAGGGGQLAGQESAVDALNASRGMM